MSDPSGWVTNPPRKFVKIHSLTSQPTMNGQTALVIAFENGRYILISTSFYQRRVSMKPENLKSCSYMESLVAQWTMLSQNPEIRRQVQEKWSAIQRILPSFIQTPERVAAVLVVALLSIFWLLGFTRTLLLLTFGMLSGMLLGPIWNSRRHTETLRLVLPRMQTLIQQSGLPFATRISSNKVYTGACLVLIVFVFVIGMMPRSLSSSEPAQVTPSQHTSTTSMQDIEFFYKLGFDDATTQKPFGHSLQNEVDSHRLLSPPLSKKPVGMLPDDAFADDAAVPTYLGNPPPQKSRSRFSRTKNPFSFGNLVTLGMAGNTLYQLGVTGNPDGSRTWTLNTMKRNFSTLPPWKMGLLGLSLYRLVSIFL